MSEQFDEALKNTLALIRANVPADDALKYSQAALNLAQAKAVLAQVKK